MNKLIAWTVCFLFLAGSAPPTSDGPPVSVFADLDGTWSGSFVGYDTTGQELYRISVRQVYRTIDSETQTVSIEDTLEDGTVITGQGRNVARRKADGSLELICTVEKSNGDRVEHQGRLARDPDGVPQIFWSNETPDRLEVFRETVRREGEDWIYTIDGVGRYGGTYVVMAGRYRKTAP